jgi:hypothetical protein
MLQANLRVFLGLLGADANDGIISRWLDRHLAMPAAGRAAWARERLGLSAIECDQLRATFPQALDYERTGLFENGIYAVAHGPRGQLVRIALREHDGEVAVVPAAKRRRNWGALVQLPQRRSAG